MRTVKLIVLHFYEGSDLVKKKNKSIQLTFYATVTWILNRLQIENKQIIFALNIPNHHSMNYVNIMAFFNFVKKPRRVRRLRITSFEVKYMAEDFRY